MDSVLVDPSSPDQLHSNFAQAANGAAQGIKRFTQMVEDSRTKEVMDKAKESRMKDGESITAWKVTEHEDWLDVKMEDGNDSAEIEEEEGAAEASDGPNIKDVNAVLEKFRSIHVSIEALLDEDERTVTVSYARDFVQHRLKFARSIYLCQPKSTSRSGLLPTPKAMRTTALTAKTSRKFTDWFLMRSEHGLDRKI